MDISVPSIVEALVFATDFPISRSRISSIVGTITPGDVVQIIGDLNRQYELGKRPLKIVEIAGGYQLLTKEEFAPWISKLFSTRRKVKLSPAALETIAIIAYRQPIPRMEVERIRGVNVDGVLKSLVDRGFIRIVGRDKGMGRPFLYGTTPEFLSHFGLKKISNLPDYEKVRNRESFFPTEGTAIVEPPAEGTELPVDDES